ncbi:hypothetical protein QUV83_10240 [Cellulomonas cellasea]|uniref:hypothetical protein n=1 Tax=Cellulomonas cellasea TaxID=43670 RepID=UPI0025A3A44C|nr:hypothetical protein [Cellulomonas cellasea]MDM8085144.1 hypothetical protein [Cellulomonas cellasea]
MDEDRTFNPAETLPEASARMFALSRSADAGTRGPKRALVALATGLGLDVDLVEVNAVLGERIAEEFGLSWRAGRDYVDLQVTLTGMNNLLRGATQSLERLSRERRVDDASATEVLLAFPGFRPARSKQEAVNRMCDLAGVPWDMLGPGGKEHTWTLKDLARRLAPQLLDMRLTKHELAAALCDAFGVPWLASAGSTGASITLDGLNLILAGAERRARVASAGWATAHEEGAALVAVLGRGLPSHWDGREAVLEMRESGSTQWRQMEWAGFYFEEKVREVLNEAYPTPPVGGPQVRFGSTVFDYASATRVWDAKAHTAMRVMLPDGEPYRDSGDAVCWLNDARAMRECVELQGLGFLVAEGLSGFDTTGEFKDWHKDLGNRAGRKVREYVPSTGRSRPRKASFTPLELRAVWIEDLVDLDAAILSGWLRQDAQPRWEGTVARNDKFKARVADAGNWQVAHHIWDRGYDL